MRYLTLNVVLELYRQVMEQSGGLTDIRDVFTDWQRDHIVKRNIQGR